MMRPAPTRDSCGHALRALIAGRWDDWSGLPERCTFASVAGEMGGSEVLDSIDYLGSAGVSCARSSLGNAPVLVWHAGDMPLLVECDLLGTPREPPPLDGPAVRRLDVHWGAGMMAGGEAVIAERGLALILTRKDRVVACRGFAPMTFDDYVLKRRPSSEPLKPFQPLLSEGGLP